MVVRIRRKRDEKYLDRSRIEGQRAICYAVKCEPELTSDRPFLTPHCDHDRKLRLQASLMPQMVAENVRMLVNEISPGSLHVLMCIPTISKIVRSDVRLACER